MANTIAGQLMHLDSHFGSCERPIAALVSVKLCPGVARSLPPMFVYSAVAVVKTGCLAADSNCASRRLPCVTFGGLTEPLKKAASGDAAVYFWQPLTDSDLYSAVEVPSVTVPWPATLVVYGVQVSHCLQTDTRQGLFQPKLSFTKQPWAVTRRDLLVSDVETNSETSEMLRVVPTLVEVDTLVWPRGLGPFTLTFDARPRLRITAAVIACMRAGVFGEVANHFFRLGFGSVRTTKIAFDVVYDKTTVLSKLPLTYIMVRNEEQTPTALHVCQAAYLGPVTAPVTEQPGMPTPGVEHTMHATLKTSQTEMYSKETQVFLHFNADFVASMSVVTPYPFPAHTPCIASLFTRKGNKFGMTFVRSEKVPTVWTLPVLQDADFANLDFIVFVSLPFPGCVVATSFCAQFDIVESVNLKRESLCPDSDVLFGMTSFKTALCLHQATLLSRLGCNQKYYVDDVPLGTSYITHGERDVNVSKRGTWAGCEALTWQGAVPDTGAHFRVNRLAPHIKVTPQLAACVRAGICGQYDPDVDVYRLPIGWVYLRRLERYDFL